MAWIGTFMFQERRAGADRQRTLSREVFSVEHQPGWLRRRAASHGEYDRRNDSSFVQKRVKFAHPGGTGARVPIAEHHESSPTDGRRIPVRVDMRANRCVDRHACECHAGDELRAPVSTVALVDPVSRIVDASSSDTSRRPQPSRQRWFSNGGCRLGGVLDGA